MGLLHQFHYSPPYGTSKWMDPNPNGSGLRFSPLRGNTKFSSARAHSSGIVISDQTPFRWFVVNNMHAKYDPGICTAVVSILTSTITDCYIGQESIHIFTYIFFCFRFIHVCTCLLGVIVWPSMGWQQIWNSAGTMLVMSRHVKTHFQMGYIRLYHQYGQLQFWGSYQPDVESKLFLLNWISSSSLVPLLIPG